MAKGPYIPPPPKKIDPAKIGTYIKSLADEILNAAIHYKMYLDLNEATKTYVDYMNISRAFWGLTLNAHLVAAQSSLFRAYDFSNDGVNLFRLLANIEDHLPKSSPIDAAEIDADRKLVARDEPTTKKHLWQRNKTFAHKDFSHVVAPKVKNSVTYGDLDTLITRAVEILNKYSNAIQRQSWAMTMTSGDDYKYVLEAVKNDWNAQMKQDGDEAAEMGGDPK